MYTISAKSRVTYVHCQASKSLVTVFVLTGKRVHRPTGLMIPHFVIPQFMIHDTTVHDTTMIPRFMRPQFMIPPFKIPQFHLLKDSDLFLHIPNLI